MLLLRGNPEKTKQMLTKNTQIRQKFNTDFFWKSTTKTSLCLKSITYLLSEMNILEELSGEQEEKHHSWNILKNIASCTCSIIVFSRVIIFEEIFLEKFSFWFFSTYYLSESVFWFSGINTNTHNTNDYHSALFSHVFFLNQHFHFSISMALLKMFDSLRIICLLLLKFHLEICLNSVSAACNEFRFPPQKIEVFRQTGKPPPPYWYLYRCLLWRECFQHR